MGGNGHNKDISKNRMATRKSGAKRGRKIGWKKTKRGRPPNKTDKVDSNNNALNRTSSIDSKTEETQVPPERKTGYHEQALKFECGICGGKIRRDASKRNHKEGIFGYKVLNGYSHSVYPEKETDNPLSSVIEKVFEIKYPKNNFYNPNICASCYDYVQQQSKVNTLELSENAKELRRVEIDSHRIKRSMYSDPEHTQKREYDSEYNCQTCDLAKLLHPFTNKPEKPEPTIKLCFKPLRDKAGPCLLPFDHAGNCSKKQSVDNFLNLGIGKQYMEQIISTALKRKETEEGLTRNDKMVLSTFGGKITCDLGKSREIDRTQQATDVETLIADARDNHESKTKQRKSLAGKRKEAKNNNYTVIVFVWYLSFSIYFFRTL